MSDEEARDLAEMSSAWELLPGIQAKLHGLEEKIKEILAIPEMQLAAESTRLDSEYADGYNTLRMRVRNIIQAG